MMADELFEITNVDHDEFESSLMSYMQNDPFIQKEMQHYMSQMGNLSKEAEDKQKKTDKTSHMKGLDFKKTHTEKKLK
jgi:hypothetical protein